MNGLPPGNITTRKLPSGFPRVPDPFPARVRDDPCPVVVRSKTQWRPSCNVPSAHVRRIVPVAVASRRHVRGEGGMRAGTVGVFRRRAPAAGGRRARHASLDAQATAEDSLARGQPHQDDQQRQQQGTTTANSYFYNPRLVWLLNILFCVKIQSLSVESQKNECHKSAARLSSTSSVHQDKPQTLSSSKVNFIATRVQCNHLNLCSRRSEWHDSTNVCQRKIRTQLLTRLQTATTAPTKL